MRLDKLTTQFQQALADAQSLAIANDNQYIEPVHVLASIAGQPDGSGRTLLERAGIRATTLKTAADAAIKRLPQVSGTGGEIQIGRDLVNLLNLSEKEALKRGDQYIATEMFLLALTRTRARRVASRRKPGSRAKRSKRRSTRCAAARASTTPKPKASARR